MKPSRPARVAASKRGSAGGALLERGGVLATVTGILDAAGSGRGATLFIAGEAGLGKSAVLGTATSLAGDRFRIGFASGDPMQASLPFGLFGQALHSLGAPDLVDAAPAGSSPVDARAAHVYGVLRWLESAGMPILLALDDIHWADQDSLLLLSFLARRLESLPVALIATFRPWPEGAAQIASSLAHEGRATLDRLEPLTEEAAADLLSERVGHADAGLFQRAWKACAGNPLLLEQTGLAISRGENLPEDAAGRRSTFSHDLLLARFAGLTGTGIRLAQAASVFGSRFRPQLAIALAQLNEAEADSALEAIGRSGLVREAGDDMLEFVHALFAQAAYEDLGAIRPRYHARAFQILARHGLEAEAAVHARSAGLVGDPEAVALIERVGRAAHQAGALAAAVENLQSAVDFAGSHAGPDLLLALGQALQDRGVPEQSCPVYERLLVISDLSAGHRAKALHMLSRALAVMGDGRQAGDRFAEAVVAAEAVDPDSAVDVLIDQAIWSWWTVGPAEAVQVADKARELAGRAGAALRMKAEATHGFLALEAGDATAAATLEAAAAMIEAVPLANVAETFGAFGSMQHLGAATLFTERFAASDRIFRLAREEADRVGAPEAIGFLASQHGYALTRMGRLPEALEMVELAGSLAEVLPLLSGVAVVGRAYILLLMGRLDESSHWCGRLEEIASDRRGYLPYLVLWDVIGHRALREGRSREASDTYARLEAAVKRTGMGDPCLVPWSRHAIEAHIACGEVEAARSVLTWLELQAEHIPWRWPRIAAACGRAWLAEAENDPERAESGFLEALRLHREGEPMPVEEVETLLAMGTYLQRAGHPARARPHLAEAARLAKDAGADWLAGFARAALAVAGGRRRRARSAHDQLTPQELRVARLAGSGLGNREIAGTLHLSVSTIETHLQRVFAKLEIRSRRQLMTMALDPDKDQGDP